MLQHGDSQPIWCLPTPCACYCTVGLDPPGRWPPQAAALSWRRMLWKPSLPWAVSNSWLVHYHSPTMTLACLVTPTSSTIFAQQGTDAAYPLSCPTNPRLINLSYPLFSTAVRAGNSIIRKTEFFTAATYCHSPGYPVITPVLLNTSGCSRVVKMLQLEIGGIQPQQSWYPHASCQNLAGFVKFFVISAYLSSTTMHLLELGDKNQIYPSWSP